MPPSFIRGLFPFSLLYPFLTTMLQSMTGFGKATAQNDFYKVTVETRSVNSKQADLSVRIPSDIRAIEMDLRRKATQTLLRGKIDIIVSVERQSQQGRVRIDAELAEHYWNAIQDLSLKTGIDMPQDPMRTVLLMPHVLVTTPTEDEDLELMSLTHRALDGALLAHQEFRMQEGEALEKAFEKNIKTIQDLLTQVEPYENERIETVRNKLKESLQKLSELNMDNGRLEQEMIFYIEKLDVTEEKNRLQNHLQYFLDTMRLETVQGRKLGFIAQEIGREINTLGSKANHTEIQKIVVLMKDQLEQIKEQVLNIL